MEVDWSLDRASNKPGALSSDRSAVKGAYGLGLKAVAKALHTNNLIGTSWGSSQVDGMGAMTAAWFCDNEADKDESRLMDYPLMQEVGAYNEVDCRVLQEILYYLRSDH